MDENKREKRQRTKGITTQKKGQNEESQHRKSRKQEESKEQR